MTNFFKSFFKDESGAVTVDWVVLTAAIVGLAIVAWSTFGTTVNDSSTQTAAAITEYQNQFGW